MARIFFESGRTSIAAHVAFFCAVWVAWAGFPQANLARGPQPRIIVESVTKDGVAQKAGLRPGDLILAWGIPSTGPTGKTQKLLEGSVCDLVEFELDSGPRGQCTLKFRRGETTSELALSRTPWGFSARPLLDGPGEATFRDALQLRDSGQRAAASVLLEKIAQELDSGGGEGGWWYRLEALKWNPGSAEGAGEGGPNSEPAVGVRPEQRCEAVRRLEEVGELERSRKHLDRAATFLREAVHLGESAPLGEVALSQTLNRLGSVLRDSGDFKAAAEAFERALAIQNRLIPGSLLISDTLTYLGDIRWKSGSLSEAESFHQAALEIRKGLDPLSPKTAASLNNLGVLAWTRGDAVKAEKYYKESLAIKENINKDDPGIAATLNNLAVIMKNRGDLAASEAFQKRAIALNEKHFPNSIKLATSIMNLATLLQVRGDWEGSRSLFERALSLYESNGRGNREHALCLGNFGALLGDLGEWDRAEECLLNAIQAYDRIAPGSSDVAGLWFNLGLVMERKGDEGKALRYLFDAWDRYRRIAPDGSWAAYCTDEIARVCHHGGKLDEARALFLSTLPTWEQLAPGSSYEAEVLYGLGAIARERGQPEEARLYLCGAIRALESQQARLGGSETQKSAFGAQRHDYYQTYATLLLEGGDPAGALEVLERGRARVFLEMLASRDLTFDLDTNPELEGERRAVSAERRRVEQELLDLSPEKEAARVSELGARLRELQRIQGLLLEKQRAFSPRLASLRDPVPLGASEIAARLEEGTLLISFGVGEDETLVAILRKGWDSPRIVKLAVGRRGLGIAVRRFRRLIEDRQPVTEASQGLGLQVLGPIADEIRNAERLLIMPDGPLYALPFGALCLPPAHGTDRAKFLSEEKPLQEVLSMTVYAELSQPGSPGMPAPPVIVFAVSKPSAVLEGLPEIPAVYDEAKSVATAFTGGSFLYMGKDATVPRLESFREAHYVHLACHGLLDETFPLESCLVLESDPSSGRDGLLHAWEILERVRLESDMVVLSACRSGLGKEMGGEGFIGLTRSFQYAGARSVLASLWSVHDTATATFMANLYQRLAEGASKAEALRGAQLESLRRPISLEAPSWRVEGVLDTSHPYYWAGFVLNGGE